MTPYLSPEIQELAKSQGKLCKVFSNPQRVLILWLIAEKERTVTEIALAIGASMQSTSQHLHIMGMRNLVEPRREHHNVYYHLADNEMMKDCMVLKNRPVEMHLEIPLI
jgi:DNA-binding transcriptional ArsR family regulator